MNNDDTLQTVPHTSQAIINNRIIERLRCKAMMTGYRLQGFDIDQTSSTFIRRILAFAVKE